MCKFNPKNEGRRIDPCMKNIIFILNHYSIKTVACCCGHKKYTMSIIIKDKQGIYELFSDKEILRKKRFYKRDKQGYYFIPEAI